MYYSETEKVKNLLKEIDSEPNYGTSNAFNEILEIVRKLEKDIEKFTEQRNKRRYTFEEIEKVKNLIRQGNSMNQTAIIASKEFEKSFSKTTVFNIWHDTCKPKFEFIDLCPDNDNSLLPNWNNYSEPELEALNEESITLQMIDLE